MKKMIFLKDYYQTLDYILSFNKSYEHPENPSRKRMEKDLPYMKLLSEKLQKKDKQHNQYGKDISTYHKLYH